MPLIRFRKYLYFNTSRQNELKWRKTCTGLKFDLEHFNGPKSKFIRDSLYKHPVHQTNVISCAKPYQHALDFWINTPPWET